MMKLSTLCYIERGGCYLMLHRVKKQHDVNGASGSVWAASWKRMNRLRSALPAR